MTEVLARDEIEARLADLPGWTTDGHGIERTYSLAHLPAAALLLHVAVIQDELDHHSDATLGYYSLRVAITTHSLGGQVSERDVELARRIEAVAAAHGAT